MTGGEVGKWRHLVLPYCQGEGLDIGYGGYALRPSSITIDLPSRYSHGPDPQHLYGDARKLPWFKAESFSYVFSSHMLEDIPNDQKPDVLLEWYRVLRPGGNLVLLLPDEQRYRRVSRTRNHNHDDPHFCLETVLNMAKQLPSAIIVEAANLFVDAQGNPDYNFWLVIKRGGK